MMRKMTKSKRFIGDKSCVAFKKNKKATEMPDMTDIQTDKKKLADIKTKNNKVREKIKMDMRVGEAQKIR